ncbi:MAG: phage tail sheath C-terminal domain-containing protein [Pseudomonadota bacterium]
MAQYKTPDVYVHEKSVLPASVAEVPTAIPAFIGYTEKTRDKNGDTLKQVPTRISSLLDYKQQFGGAWHETFQVNQLADSTEFALDSSTPCHVLSKFFLYQAIEHFYTNGGGTCYIVSIGGYTKESNTITNAETAKKTTETAKQTAETAKKTAETTSEKEDYLSAIDQLKKTDEITLVACPESVRLDDADHYAVQQKMLDHCADLGDRFALIDVKQTGKGVQEDAKLLRNNVTQGLKYGAAYYPYLQTTMTRDYAEDTVTVTHRKKDDKSKATEHTLKLSELDDTNRAGASTVASNKVRALLNTNYVTLPPSAAIAGVIAKTDAARGVWKAPANVALAMVVGPKIHIDRSEQENLNIDVVAGKSINAIRNFTGKGTLVWGARTLAGNDNEWRYIQTRRLFNTVEESIQKSIAFAVFEPNTPLTWLKIRTMIESYLETLWQQGAFFGNTAQQAFFVNVGLGQTMTEDDINNGLMKIEIGLAMVRPAEFIVLTFSHKSITS